MSLSPDATIPPKVRSLSRRIDVAGLVLTCLLAGVVAYIGIGGSLKKIADLNVELIELSKQLAYQTELENVLGEGEVKLETLHQEITKLELLLPETISFQDFYTILDACGKEASVLISEVQPGQIGDGEGYQVMPIPISLLATYEDFYEFLFLLTHSSRMTKLASLSIRPARIPEMYNVDLTVRIYCSGGEAPANEA